MNTSSLSSPGKATYISVATYTWCTITYACCAAEWLQCTIARVRNQNNDLLEKVREGLRSVSGGGGDRGGEEGRRGEGEEGRRGGGEEGRRGGGEGRRGGGEEGRRGGGEEERRGEGGGGEEGRRGGGGILL